MNIFGWWLLTWAATAGVSVFWIMKRPPHETPAMENVRGFGTKAGFLPCFTFSILFVIVAGAIYLVMKSRLDSVTGQINLPTSFDTGSGGTPPPRSGPPANAANPFAEGSQAAQDEAPVESTKKHDADPDAAGPAANKSNPFL